MFTPAQRISHGSVVEVEVCVVGAGAAGLVFAREFLGSPTSVCVLESGQMQTAVNRTLIGVYRFIHNIVRRVLNQRAARFVLKKIVRLFAYDPLYDVETTGLPVAHESRRRAFGGSMIAWGGKWARYNTIDLIKRPWVEHSGWPLTLSELQPYYARASQSLHAPDLTHDTFDENFLGEGAFETLVFFRQGRRLRNWGMTLRHDFMQAQNINVHTGAHVVSINKDGSRIKDVSVKTTQGNSYTVRARYFVLACGGIENPRLLLISNLGNEHDQVGRYYMDHPLGRCGVIETSREVDLSRYWDPDGTCVGFRLSNTVQEQEAVLDSHIFLESSAYEPTFLGKIKRKITGKKASTRVSVRNHLEQAPTPTNRVTLSSTKDTLGLPKAKIQWMLSELDKKSIVVLHRYLGKRVAEAGIGELKSPLLASAPNFELVSKDAAHHMGTTRMGQDPATSVVDQNCRVHSLDNLFVAGSSLFPTSGSANPTATICALAVRLADHIKTKL